MGNTNRTITALEIAVARNDEQTKTLFSLLGEIKESIDRIVLKVEASDAKPDTFKDFMAKQGMSIFEKAMLGGAIAYILFKLGL